MRNGHKPIAERLVALALAAGVAAGLGAVAGCRPKAQTLKPAPGTPSASSASSLSSGQPASAGDANAVLGQGYAALEQKQFDDAIARADQVLGSVSHGEGSAEALYLKGRALEAKTAAGVIAPDVKTNLQQARQAYIAALQRNPREPLKAYVHTSLGNVAYFQDDYPTAVAQFNAAYEKLQSPEMQAWVLYRIGLSQQRQGQFEPADRTFAQVEKAHPNTEPARRAREHVGARAYFVQLATYASPQTAQSAAAELKKQGVAAAVQPGPEGRAFLRVGPIATYGQALYYKQRYAEKYPDAVIIP